MVNHLPSGIHFIHGRVKNHKPKANDFRPDKTRGYEFIEPHAAQPQYER